METIPEEGEPKVSVKEILARFENLKGKENDLNNNVIVKKEPKEKKEKKSDKIKSNRETKVVSPTPQPVSSPGPTIDHPVVEVSVN